MASSILSALVHIEGHGALFYGKDTAEVADRRTAHAGQVGNVPNVDFHQSNEAHKNRQSVLRAEATAAAETAPVAPKSEKPRIVAVEEDERKAKQSGKQAIPRHSSHQEPVIFTLHLHLP